MIALQNPSSGAASRGHGDRAVREVRGDALILVFEEEREVLRIDAGDRDAFERAVNFAMVYSAESRRPIRVRGVLGDVPDWEFTLSKAYYS